MVDKQVKFNIVVGGIPQVRSAMKGVSEAATDMLRKIDQANQRNAQRIIEINRNKLNVIKKLNDSEVGDEEKKIKRILEIETRAARQIKAIRERQANQERHLAENTAAAVAKANSKLVPKPAGGGSGLNLSAMGHVAGAMGMYRVGHAIRAAGQLGIGSEIGSSGITLTGGVAALGVAVGALLVAGKLIEVGFNSVAQQAQYLATSFMGAITQIGGAKNLQEMLVEATAKEKSEAKSRFTVSQEERLGAGQIQNISNNLAKQSKLGGFTSEDWIETIGNMGAISGRQKSIPTGFLEFIGKMAHVGGTSVQSMGDIAGRIWAANPTASAEDVQNILLAGHTIGQKGAFSVGEIPQATGLIKGAGQLGGNTLQNTLKAFAIGTILRPRAGDLQQSGVEFNSFILQTMLAHAHGANLPGVKFNKQGSIMNIEEAIASAVSTPAQSRPAPYHRAESQQFLANMARQAGVTDADSPTQIKEKVHQLLDSYEKLHTSMEEFNDENQQSISTQDVLKAEFNDLADQLEIALLPVLQELVPEIKEFVKVLIDKKDNISESFKLLIQAIFQLVPIALMTGKGLLYLGEAAGYFVEALSVMIDSMTGGLFHEKMKGINEAAQGVIDSQGKLIPIIDQLSESFNNLGKAVPVNIAENQGKDILFHKSHPGFIGPPSSGQLTNDALTAAAMDMKRNAEHSDAAAVKLKSAAEHLDRAAEKFSKQPDW